MDRFVTRMSFPTAIVFGPGALKELPVELKRLGAVRPLIVTDKGVAQAGLLGRVIEVMTQAGIQPAVFDTCQLNPTDQDAENGLAIYQSEKCDSVIGLGGGSPLDAAKLVRLRVTHPAPLSRYDDATGGDRFITSNLPPMVAIPTTAGTGSEVGRSGVATLPDTGRKTVIFSPFLMAGAAICDPDLTLGLPPGPTAATGIDAFTHCLEAYLANGNHPLADAIALEGISKVVANLERAVSHGSTDLEARTEMMAAAMMGAIAFQKGLGACHSLAHALTPLAGIHHGLANALCLPAVVRFNREVSQKRMARAAVAMGANPSLGEAQLADSLAERVAGLITSAGIKSGLSNHKVTPALLPAIAEKAFEDACHQLNPRPCTKADLLNLAQASM